VGESKSWLCVNDGFWAIIKLVERLILEFEEGVHRG
jgi:hypothetical protein